MLRGIAAGWLREEAAALEVDLRAAWLLVLAMDSLVG
jgi:hypothetical protein